MTKETVEPDNTAVRVALWRALHVQIDARPHVLEDEIGLKIVAPGDDWRSRPDMSSFTRPFRASILARARLIDDLVAEKAGSGVTQYVILGAGLDTFAQRRTDIASRLTIFEADKPGAQKWKQQRLVEAGLGIPPYLKFVPVNFEEQERWWDRIVEHGFDVDHAAVVASTGVSMYLTKEATAATLARIASLAQGTTFAMSFMLPIEMSEPELRPAIERAAKGAQASGTPFLSFYTPEEIVATFKKAGFRDVLHVSAENLARRYFAGRTDGLRPPNNAEEMIVASV